MVVCVVYAYEQVGLLQLLLLLLLSVGMYVCMNECMNECVLVEIE